MLGKTVWSWGLFFFFGFGLDAFWEGIILGRTVRF